MEQKWRENNESEQLELFNIQHGDAVLAGNFGGLHEKWSFRIVFFFPFFLFGHQSLLCSFLSTYFHA